LLAHVMARDMLPPRFRVLHIQHHHEVSSVLLDIKLEQKKEGTDLKFGAVVITYDSLLCEFGNFKRLVRACLWL